VVVGGLFSGASLPGASAGAGTSCAGGLGAAAAGGAAPRDMKAPRLPAADDVIPELGPTNADLASLGLCIAALAAGSAAAEAAGRLELSAKRSAAGGAFGASGDGRTGGA